MIAASVCTGLKSSSKFGSLNICVNENFLPILSSIPLDYVGDSDFPWGADEAAKTPYPRDAYFWRVYSD